MARLLLDENVPRSVGAMLGDAGHDLRFIADIEPAADDLRVLALARADARTLVTFDADFGELLFRRQARPPPAVVYLRMNPVAASGAASLVLRALAEDPNGRFVVVTAESIRSRPLAAPA